MTTPKKRAFLIKYQETNVCEVEIEAATKAEARRMFDDGDWADGVPIDSLGIDFISIQEET